MYQITGPIFDRVEIELNPDYYEGKSIVIRAENNEKQNPYIKTASFNGKKVKDFTLSHDLLVRGGTLQLKMSPQPSNHKNHSGN